jgi:hypothetical protein
MGVLRLTVHPQKHTHQFVGRVEVAPADSRIADKASGTGLCTAGLPISEVKEIAQLDCG